MHYKANKEPPKIVLVFCLGSYIIPLYYPRASVYDHDVVKIVEDSIASIKG